MSMEIDLYTVLGTVCPRVFPDEAPYGTELPYIIWEQIGGMALTFVEGALPDGRGSTVQINVWHSRRDLANAMALEIEAAMVATPLFAAKAASAFAAAAADQGEVIRGTSQDFDIWALR